MIESNINQILPLELVRNTLQLLNEADQKTSMLVCHVWREHIVEAARSQESNLIDDFQVCLQFCFCSQPNLSQKFTDFINPVLERVRSSNDFHEIRKCPFRIMKKSLDILKTCTTENILLLLNPNSNIPPLFRDGLPLQELLDWNQAKEMPPGTLQDKKLLAVARAFLEIAHFREAEEALQSITSHSYASDEIFAEILVHQKNKLSKEELQGKLRSHPWETIYNISVILTKKRCDDELAVEVAMARHSIEGRKASLEDICKLRAEDGIEEGKALAELIPDQEIRKYVFSLLEDAGF